MKTKEDYMEALREPTFNECGQSQGNAYLTMVEKLCEFAEQTQIPLQMAWSIRVTVSRSMREGTSPNDSLRSSKLWRDGGACAVSYNNKFTLNAI